MNAFERLGLPRRFSLDQSAIDAAYLACSRASHPDYHQSGSSVEQAASERVMAELNGAYTTLSDPFERITHLLQLAGGPAASEQKHQDPAFLMEMLDVRERMESGEDVSAELTAKLSEHLAAAGSPFDAATPPTPAECVAVRTHLNAAKTILSLLNQ